MRENSSFRTWRVAALGDVLKKQPPYPALCGGRRGEIPQRNLGTRVICDFHRFLLIRRKQKTFAVAKSGEKQSTVLTELRTEAADSSGGCGGSPAEPGYRWCRPQTPHTAISAAVALFAGGFKGLSPLHYTYFCLCDDVLRVHLLQVL